MVPVISCWTRDKTKAGSVCLYSPGNLIFLLIVWMRDEEKISHKCDTWTGSHWVRSLPGIGNSKSSRPSVSKGDWFQDCFPQAPWIPTSLDAQVPYIKWHYTVGSLYPRVLHWQIRPTAAGKSIGWIRGCGTQEYGGLALHILGPGYSLYPRALQHRVERALSQLFTWSYCWVHVW